MKSTSSTQRPHRGRHKRTSEGAKRQLQSEAKFVMHWLTSGWHKHHFPRVIARTSSCRPARIQDAQASVVQLIAAVRDNASSCAQTNPGPLTQTPPRAEQSLRSFSESRARRPPIASKWDPAPNRAWAALVVSPSVAEAMAPSIVVTHPPASLASTCPAARHPRRP